MVCQCSGTWKGIKSKVGGELDTSLQALFAYLCVFYVLVIALIPRNVSSNPNTPFMNPLFHERFTWKMTPFWRPLAKGTSKATIQV